MAEYMDLRVRPNNSSHQRNMEAIIKLDAQNVTRSTTLTQNPIVSTSFTVAQGIFGIGSSNEPIQEVESDPVEEEISRYRCEPRVRNDINILEWWKQRKDIYPILSKIARFYLGISATSVATERVFSAGGNVITKLRMSMTDEHANQLIFISKNKNKIPLH